MAGITPQIADTVYAWSNTFLVLGAVLALVGTMGAYWSGGIREKYADERIAINEAATARAKADAAEANLAQLKLKNEMAWRSVSPVQAQALIDSLTGSNLEFWLSFVGNDPEASVYREYLGAVLEKAGLRILFYSGYERAVGVRLMGGSDEERKIVIDAFVKANIPLSISEQHTSLSKDRMEILVGTKPPPQFIQ